MLKDPRHLKGKNAGSFTELEKFDSSISLGRLLLNGVQTRMGAGDTNPSHSFYLQSFRMLCLRNKVKQNETTSFNELNLDDQRGGISDSLMMLDIHWQGQKVRSI